MESMGRKHNSKSNCLLGKVCMIQKMLERGLVIFFFFGIGNKLILPLYIIIGLWLCLSLGQVQSFRKIMSPPFFLHLLTVNHLTEI